MRYSNAFRIGSCARASQLVLALACASLASMPPRSDPDALIVPDHL